MIKGEIENFILTDLPFFLHSRAMLKKFVEEQYIICRLQLELAKSRIYQHQLI